MGERNTGICATAAVSRIIFRCEITGMKVFQTFGEKPLASSLVFNALKGI